MWKIYNSEGAFPKMKGKNYCDMEVDSRRVDQGASFETSMRAGPSKTAGESMARKMSGMLPAL